MSFISSLFSSLTSTDSAIKSTSSDSSNDLTLPTKPKRYCDNLVDEFYDNLKTYKESQKEPETSLDQTFYKLFNHLEDKKIKIICDEKCHSPAHMGYLKINPLQVTLCDHNIENRLKLELNLNKHNNYLNEKEKNKLNNEIKNRIKETLVHEFTHAYDYINSRVNFHTCNGLAYTEIRAARNGNCDTELLNKIPLFKSICTYFAARDSTQSFYPRDTDKCLINVFLEAYKDHEPKYLKENLDNNINNNNNNNQNNIEKN